jgi:DNA cross-link repair 1A protein
MKVPGTDIEVDDFRPRDAGTIVLTHYHADHYRGLATGEARPVLCSSITAELLHHVHEVPRSSLLVLDPGESTQLAGGVRVKAFDANHCPGALMLLFDVSGRRVLHTGDFRYCAAHDAHSELFDDIDVLMLDATYEDGGDEHPSQDAAIEDILALIRAHPQHRVLLGVYRIGKNRIVRAIHRELGLKTSLSRDYHRIYELLGMDDCVTLDRDTTRVHGYGMRYFTERDAARDPSTIAILPTGYRTGKRAGERVFFVAYSEHSSPAELKAFVAKVAPRNIIRTNEPF